MFADVTGVKSITPVPDVYEIAPCPEPVLVAESEPLANPITSAFVRSVNDTTPVPASYERSPLAEIELRARAVVKYLLVAPSLRSSVSFDASSLLKSTPSK